MSTANLRGKPVHVARVGHVRVPVQTYADGRLVICWRQTAGGRRIRETFTVKKEAIARAEEVALAIANSLADVVTLSSADRDSYRLAVQKLARMAEKRGDDPVPLHAAVDEYVAARERVAPHTLMEAANFFARGHVERLTVPSTSRILDDLLAELADDRREARRYIGPLKQDLLRFVAAFPDLQDATEDAVREYLRNLRTTRKRRQRDGTFKPAGAPVSARRRDNVRDAIVRLMRFARKRGYLPGDKTSAAEYVPRVSEGGEVTTFSPQQLADILQHFATRDREWLPWAAIAAFAGLRTSEILRLDWSAFKWEAGSIAVSSRVARKVRVSRQAPLLAPLAAWLADWREQTGPVIPRKWKDMEAAHSDALARLRRALGWPTWDNNALRHSFGSNRLAIVKSYAHVALEMGNSPAQVREHYNDPKPESEARTYFAVMPPESVRNLIPFREAR